MARKTNYRKLKKTMLIVVEGQTESIYFNQLKSENRLPNLSVEPKICPRKDPLNIVKRANIENQRKEFDYTWCIFDTDTVKHNQENYHEAKKKAKKFNYKIAESFPCFEIWFLFHFIYTTKYYANYLQLRRDLCKYITDYCKKQEYLKKKNLYIILNDKIPKAIENCEKLDKHNRLNKSDRCTKCDIFKIIRNINELIK